MSCIRGEEGKKALCCITQFIAAIDILISIVRIYFYLTTVKLKHLKVIMKAKRERERDRERREGGREMFMKPFLSHENTFTGNNLAHTQCISSLQNMMLVHPPTSFSLSFFFSFSLPLSLFLSIFYFFLFSLYF